MACDASGTVEPISLQGGGATHAKDRTTDPVAPCTCIYIYTYIWCMHTYTYVYALGCYMSRSINNPSGTSTTHEYVLQHKVLC